jgi:CxxC motif-containing protein (DUF1111 family)
VVCGGAPPPPQTTQSIDPGPRGGTPGAGGAIPELNQNEQNFFTAALGVFNEVDTVAVGLGPRFNMDGCGGCHAFPAAGGSSPPTNPQVAVATKSGARNTVPSFITAKGPVREVRFVNNPNGTPDGGVHALFVISGRSDAPGCNITQPNFAAAVSANNAIFRIPTPTFGLGYIEAIPDAGLQSTFSAAAQKRGALGISGSFNHSGNDGTITRFGWKAQNKSLLIFSGEAYNVEQGVTNDAFPNERDDTPGCQFNSLPESTSNFTDASNGASPVSGFSQDIVNFASFMRMLAPPTPAGSSAAPTRVAANGPTAIGTAAGTTSTTTSSTTVSRGQTVFSNIGCDACHIQNQTAGKSVISGVSNQTVQPYSDFALHTMGTGLQDRVSQGNANGQQFRTSPLWGVGQRLFFLHDGRTADIGVAITQHASQGSEANSVINNFNQLSLSDQQALAAFLRSL